MTVRGTARRAAALVLLLAAAGCTSDGATVIERTGRLALSQIVGPGDETPAPEREPTRAELARTGSAVIAVSFEDGPRAFVAPLALNGGYLTYYDDQRRAIVMTGGAIAGTRGQPYDLVSVRHAPEDPIATPRPPGDWPLSSVREYALDRKDFPAERIGVTCTWDQVARETIEILGRAHEVVRVEETCRNARRTIENRYWVDAGTGFVWKSVQWAGDLLPRFRIEVVRPFRGGA